MQRSSTFASLLDQKSKKFWSSPFGGKNSKDSASPSSSGLSSSKSSYSLKTSLSRSESKHKAVSSSTASSSSTSETVARSTSKTSQHRAKRNTLIIGEPTQTMASTTQKHRSFMDFNSLKLDATTVQDPKELEFYKQLLGNVNNSSTIEEEDEDATSVGSQSDNVTASSQQTTIPSTTTTRSSTSSSSQQATKLQLTIPEDESSTLTSALEDYQLFTERESFPVTPITPSMPSIKINDEPEALVSSPSVPCLVMSESVESELSVMKVSNSLWVGIDECVEGKDAFDGIDANVVFQDDEVKRVVKKRSYRTMWQRTSLVFA